MAGPKADLPLLHVTTLADWRAWLAADHATAREVWLVSCKPRRGRPRVSYDEAVEEALLRLG